MRTSYCGNLLYMIVAITGRMAMKKIIDVTHVSARGTSYRITIPRKIAKRLGLEDGDIPKFTDDNGVKISKLE